MKRRIISFLIATLILCSIFAGCGGNNDSTEPETTNVTNASTIPDLDTLTLSEFKEMTSEQQQSIAESFETPDEYASWYNDKVQESESDAEKQKDPTGTTENNDTTGSTDATDSTESTEVTESTVATESDSTLPEIPDVTIPSKDEVTYQEYRAMSGAEQKKFINSFESIDAFMAWYAKAEQEYMNSIPEFNGSTPIDLDEYFGN